MRKILAILAIAGMAGGLAASAQAEEIETDFGTITVDGSGIEADGADSNEDPLDGYVRVNSDGSACASDDGSSADDAENDGPGTCV